MPSPEAIVAMVNEGWDFNTLMDMEPGEFGFWFAAQKARNDEIAKAAKPKRK